MNAQLVSHDKRPPLAVIDSLIAEHGAWTTVRAVLSAVLRRDRALALRLSSEFNDHMRRDIGLEPEARPRMYWELRL
jgi:hypothetical protein